MSETTGAPNRPYRTHVMEMWLSRITGSHGRICALCRLGEPDWWADLMLCNIDGPGAVQQARVAVHMECVYAPVRFHRPVVTE